MALTGPLHSSAPGAQTLANRPPNTTAKWNFSKTASLRQVAADGDLVADAQAEVIQLFPG
jgi:hypothetical protein